MRIDSVGLGADGAGHELVVVRGSVLGFAGRRPFVYTQPLTLRPGSAPGRAADAIVVEPAAPPTVVGGLFPYRAALETAVREGVDRALEAAVKRIAAIELERANAGFPATHVSVTQLEVRGSSTDGSLVFRVHSGAITGVPGDIGTG